MNISVLVLTLNEESNIRPCLESASWSDDIVVLDSFSKDRTTEIASQLGARIFQRKFDNWAAHQNWAMQSIDFKHEWVLYIDADERVTPALKQEISSISTDKSNTKVAFYLGRKNYFLGKWIKHAMPPSHIMRFFKPINIRFERLVNPTPVIDGQFGYLQNYLEHYNFSKGIYEWIEKHNKYSSMEAIEGIKVIKGETGISPSLFNKDPSIRRMALKQLSFKAPLRPLLKFLYMYFFKKGLLDGAAGFTYCILQSFYEYMIVVKMKEIIRKENGLDI
jgi:glycosyltransferase involved in cell wall biosynthesis